MAELSTSTVIGRRVLENLGATRLKEANTLLEAGHYSGAIYLAGYAVECYLKVAICAALDWEGLRRTFMTHDLEILLVHSGLQRKIQNVPRVHDSFASLQGMWTMQANNAVRYRNPSDFKEVDARDFLQWIEDSDCGVVPWLRKQI